MSAPFWKADPSVWPLAMQPWIEGATPWPAELVAEDLRWWADQVAVKRETLPGRPTLARRWSWTDWAVKKALQEHDPLRRQPTASRPPADRQPTASRPPAVERANADEHADSASAPPAPRQPTASAPPADRHARGDDRADRADRTTEQTDVMKEAPTPPGVPAWLMPWSREFKTPPESLLSGLALVVQGVRGGIRPPSKTDAAEVVGLYRALDPRPPWPAFVADLALVVEAAKDCPDGLFSHDIRGKYADGTPDPRMTDRSQAVSTICVHKRWEDRLQVAKAWEAAGKPAARGSPASARASPEDPFEAALRRRQQRRSAHPDDDPQLIHPEEDPWPPTPT